MYLSEESATIIIKDLLALKGLEVHWGGYRVGLEHVRYGRF